MATMIEDEIRYAVRVRARPEACWDALATTQGLNGWFTHGADADPRPGGLLRLRWVNWGPDHVTTEDECPVLEAERGRRLVFQWHPDLHEYTTTVEMDFLADEDGAVVRVREHGYRNTPSGLRAMLECAAGWGEALALMKMYVEHGIVY